MGVTDKIKEFIGITDIDDDEDEYEEEVYEQAPRQETRNRNIEKVESYTNTKSSNVVKIHNNSDMKLYISEPENYDECTKAVDELKNRKAVVLNIEKLELEDQKQIFEFIKGAVYALEASIQKISRGIFVIAPHNIQIDGKLGDKFEGSFYSSKNR